MHPIWYRNIQVNRAIFNLNNTINDCIADIKGKTAILVGAGPSLQKNIEVVEKIRNKKNIIKIGCDALVESVHFLDYYITAEEEIISALFFKNEPAPKIITTTTANPFALYLGSSIALNMFRKEIKNGIYFYNNANPIMLVKERFSSGMLPDIPSLVPYCSNIMGHAITFAEYCEAKEIILVGCDFGVLEGQQTHFNKNHPIKYTGTQNNGWFTRHRDELKLNIGKLKIPITNCTEGGTIDFIPCMPLKEKLK